MTRLEPGRLMRGISGRKCVLFFGLLLPELAAAQRSSENAPLTQAERTAVLSNAARLFDSLYVKPAIGVEMRKALEQVERTGGLRGITAPQQFADSLTRLLRSISHDEHARIIFDPHDPRLRPSVPDPVLERDRRERRRQEIMDENFGFSSAAVLPGGIACIDVRKFADPGVGAPALEAAMNFVATSRALIVDLRHNGGGHSDMTLLFLSYFFDQPVETGEMYFRDSDKVYQSWTYARVPGRAYGQSRPVFVVTGDSTFSAAEDFAAIMKSFKRAIVIGSQTRGGGHGGNFFPIAERFLAFVPFSEARPTRPDEDIEGRGVAPDIRVQQERALDRAYVEALSVVRQKLSDPRDIAAYDDLIQTARARGVVNSAR